VPVALNLKTGYRAQEAATLVNDNAISHSGILYTCQHVKSQLKQDAPTWRPRTKDDMNVDDLGNALVMQQVMHSYRFHLGWQEVHVLVETGGERGMYGSMYARVKDSGMETVIWMAAQTSDQQVVQ
jgi:hypothetical protein